MTRGKARRNIRFTFARSNYGYILISVKESKAYKKLSFSKSPKGSKLFSQNLSDTKSETN